MHDSSNVFTDAYEKIVVFWRDNKKGLIKQTVISFIVTFVLVVLLLFWLQDPLFQGRDIYISNIVKAYVEYGFFLNIIIFVMVAYGLIQIRRAVKKDYKKDKERKINIADNSTDKLLRTKEELSDPFDIGTIEEIDEPIFGCVDGEYKGDTSIELKAGTQLVALHHDFIDENMNLICFGLAGAGKSRKKVLNDILQCIKRGDSFVCTDTKGDLLAKVYNLCMEKGYEVKIINHKPDELIYSDAIDIFSTIGSYSEILKIEDPDERQQAIDIARESCDDIAECILFNLTSDVKTKHEDFWGKEGRAFIKFWVNYVFFNEEIAPEDKNFGWILNYLETHTVKHSSSFKSQDLKEVGEEGDHGLIVGYVDELETKISTTPILKKTCAFNFSTFIGGTDTIKDSVYSGLKIDLGVFDSDLLKSITSKNEIDLSLPPKKKCAYFFVIDTVSDKNKFITSTVFTLLYKKMYSYIDKTPNRQADVPVWIIYDEFLNIGVVPKIVKFMQTARSLLIRHEMFVQTMSDFEETYELTTMNSILSNCGYWMLIKTEEQELLELWSKKSGVMTEVKIQERKAVQRLNLLKDLKNDIQESTQEVERAVMLESEIRKLKGYEVLVLKSGKDLAKIHTWDFTNHPLMKNVKPYQSTMHMPLWRMDKILANQSRNSKEADFWNNKNSKV